MDRFAAFHELDNILEISDSIIATGNTFTNRRCDPALNYLGEELLHIGHLLRLATLPLHANYQAEA